MISFIWGEMWPCSDFHMKNEYNSFVDDLHLLDEVTLYKKLFILRFWIWFTQPHTNGWWFWATTEKNLYKISGYICKDAVIFFQYLFNEEYKWPIEFMSVWINHHCMDHRRGELELFWILCYFFQVVEKLGYFIVTWMRNFFRKILSCVFINYPYAHFQQNIKGIRIFVANSAKCIENLFEILCIALKMSDVINQTVPVFFQSTLITKCIISGQHFRFWRYFLVAFHNFFWWNIAST